jgi:predicted CXXCH cytochrome family protein
MTKNSFRKPDMKPLLVMAVTAMVAAVSVMASDPPHWYSTSQSIGCASDAFDCHTTHNAAGGNLTVAAANAALCQTCHKPGGLAEDHAISDPDKAVPGTSGTSHAFGVAAIHSAYGTQRPADTEMDLRVMDDNVVCSTCHDQHAADALMGGTPSISAAQKVFSAGGSGSVTSGGIFSGTNGVFYLVEITSLSPRQLSYSKDNGGTWFGPVSFNYDVAADLDWGVQVTVSSGVAATERWEFYATYPFLRAKLVADDGSGSAMCRDCHGAWDMDHTAVNNHGFGTGPGGTDVFNSHPIGIALNANNGNYDRAEPLDGDGQPLTGGTDADGNPSNDLRFDANGNIHCLTCHGVHHADSNTLSVDGP